MSTPDLPSSLDILAPDKGLFIVTVGEGAEQRWWARQRGRTPGRWRTSRGWAHEYTSRIDAHRIAEAWEGARVEEVAP